MKSTPAHPVDQLPAEEEMLEVTASRVHNLKDVSVRIPRNKLVVITGLSGSGKSSLAFDTIYAEGQRRYIETFSSYARQFLGELERPDVDKITGLSPVISIEQKTVNKNPRSTVGTITESYDFLRLLFARASDAYSYVTNEKMVRYSDEQIVKLILEGYAGKKITILAPVVKGRKGHYRELFEQIKRMGFLRARIDGEIKDLTSNARMQVDRYKTHDIEIVIDRLEVNAASRQRIVESVQLAMKHGKGTLLVTENDKGEARHFSRHLMCPTSGISYDEPAPNLFSFNSPYGACPKCNGLGHILQIDVSKIIPNSGKSIKQGGIVPLGEYRNTFIFRHIDAIAERHHFAISDPIKDIPEDAMNMILYGTDEVLKVKNDVHSHGTSYSVSFEGVVNFIARQEEESGSAAISKWAQEFMNESVCPKCQGHRLKKDALYFRIDEKNIAELSEMDILELAAWFRDLEKRLSNKQNLIAAEVLKEIRSRLQFLIDVGLTYLTLDRNARSLSGGEAQRIRLATQIGSQLVGVLYILDEPSIGLHQRDNQRLIHALGNLRDIGNSVLVVEHDKDMILSADYILDIGPHAGIHGGRVVAEGTPAVFMASGSLTADYILGKRSIRIPKKRRTGNGKSLTLKGASGHNLNDVTVTFPLGKFICVTGVSGSGKSSLINETLYPILSKIFYRSDKKPLPYRSVEGVGNIDKVIEIDQSPIGRTTRSNPSTYTGVFSDIRNLFASLPEAKIRGYKPGRFSFNVKGGRCETCMGAGLRTIEMNFLPDVYVNCETCNGKRYNRETLEIRYKGKSISDVLNLTIDLAVEFFENIPSILGRIKAMQNVGLGYVTLGQASTTLSGGEAQRVKLATELAKKETGNTFYILDEPTTGLHFEDIRILLEVLNKLVDHGNTVLVIEHNLDIIKVADHIIDIGPEGGKGGGQILCEGTPEEIIRNKHSYTAEFLRKELN
ncbi:MAG TPA: excinuclease ABC subunit UvrA [Bacteroidia bacterium]|jgi:excinuclease ABC subunit A|nr:excinuclease ABC subunit UvrA [Bacteroidia bacterium]